MKVILAKSIILIKFSKKIPKYVHEIKDNQDYFNHIAANCGSDVLKYIPSEYQTFQLCIKTISHAKDIQYITNWDTMNQLIYHCPYMIDFCNKKHLSYDALVAAIRYNSSNARYIDCTKLPKHKKLQIIQDYNV